MATPFTPSNPPSRPTSAAGAKAAWPPPSANGLQLPTKQGPAGSLLQNAAVAAAAAGGQSRPFPFINQDACDLEQQRTGIAQGNRHDDTTLEHSRSRVIRVILYSDSPVLLHFEGGSGEQRKAAVQPDDEAKLDIGGLRRSSTLSG